MPDSHSPAVAVPLAANSSVPIQQARSPSPPQCETATQEPLESIAKGFADPPQKQSPVQPATSTLPLAHDLPAISSPPQQARSPAPPQWVACRQWLLEQLQSPSQPFTSVRPESHRPKHDGSVVQHARSPSSPQAGEIASQ